MPVSLHRECVGWLIGYNGELSCHSLVVLILSNCSIFQQAKLSYNLTFSALKIDGFIMMLLKPFLKEVSLSIYNLKQ